MPEIQMPKLSDTMTEGTLVTWKKKKGDKVSTGDVIAEIETDKATMEWESPEDGVLTEIYVEEGGRVDVGTKIAFIGEKGEAAPKEEKTEPKKEKKDQQKETEKPAPAKAKEKDTAPPQEEKKSAEPPAKAQPTRPPPQKSGEDARVKASPVARRLAAELGVDLTSVQGTGP